MYSTEKSLGEYKAKLPQNVVDEIQAVINDAREAAKVGGRVNVAVCASSSFCVFVWWWWGKNGGCCGGRVDADTDALVSPREEKEACSVTVEGAGAVACEEGAGAAACALCCLVLQDTVLRCRRPLAYITLSPLMTRCTALSDPPCCAPPPPPSSASFPPGRQPDSPQGQGGCPQQGLAQDRGDPQRRRWRQQRRLQQQRWQQQRQQRLWQQRQLRHWRRVAVRQRRRAVLRWAQAVEFWFWLPIVLRFPCPGWAGRHGWVAQ